MIKLKPKEQGPRPKAPRGVVLGAILLGMLLLALLERWRGEYALSRWKHQMGKQGEILEPERLWPKPSVQALTFSNQLKHAIEQLPPGINRFAGRIQPIVVEEPGLARRGSQEPTPLLSSPNSQSDTWQDLGNEIEQAGPALQLMRSALINPPGDMGYEVLARLESSSFPNFVNIRRAAQALHAAVILDLHRGDLNAAKENLVALGAFSKVYADDPGLVNYVIRIAVLGLSVEAGWDALQADGWTDAQLAALQQAFHCDQLLLQMPRTIEAERATRLFALGWLQAHSYSAWVSRFEPMYQSFGQKLPNSGVARASRFYREWVFHPLWGFAWADQEKAIYLQNQQREAELLREFSRAGSWKQVRARLGSIEADYRPPPARWRFYMRLPLLEELPALVSGSQDKRQYPYPDFTRAWSISIKNLTLCHMLTTAICLKRYESRHGKLPATLEALVPEIIDHVPTDLMDGQPLRYRTRPDGTYCLYSVAEDMEDNGGDATVPATDKHQRSAWDGHDWVWPQTVAVR